MPLSGARLFAPILATPPIIIEQSLIANEVPISLAFITCEGPLTLVNKHAH